MVDFVGSFEWVGLRRCRLRPSWLYILMITWLWEKRRGTWWWKMHWLTQTFSEGRLWAARSRLQLHRQWLSYKGKILLKISTYILRSVVGCGNWCAYTYRTLGWLLVQCIWILKAHKIKQVFKNCKLLMSKFFSTNTFGRISFLILAKKRNIEPTILKKLIDHLTFYPLFFHQKLRNHDHFLWFSKSGQSYRQK